MFHAKIIHRLSNYIYLLILLGTECTRKSSKHRIKRILSIHSQPTIEKLKANTHDLGYNDKFLHLHGIDRNEFNLERDHNTFPPDDMYTCHACSSRGADDMYTCHVNFLEIDVAH